MSHKYHSDLMLFSTFKTLIGVFENIISFLAFHTHQQAINPIIMISFRAFFFFELVGAKWWRVNYRSLTEKTYIVDISTQVLLATMQEDNMCSVVSGSDCHNQHKGLGIWMLRLLLKQFVLKKKLCLKHFVFFHLSFKLNMNLPWVKLKLVESISNLPKVVEPGLTSTKFQILI